MIIFGICTLPPPFPVVSKKVVLCNLWFNEQKSSSLNSVDRRQQNIIVTNKLHHSFLFINRLRCPNSLYVILFWYTLSNKRARTQHL